MTEFETASLTVAAAALAAQALIGAGQIGVVWWGIRAMVGANQDRTRAAAEDRQQHAQAMDRQDREAERRERAAERRHAETMAALNTQSRALETLIERTAR